MSFDLILILSSIGAIQSLFLGIYILSFNRKPQASGILLGLLFVAMAVRVAKSVLWAGWPETPLWVINFGFAAHAVVGPAIFLYFIHLNSTNRFSWLNIAHFFPAMVILGGLTEWPLAGIWYQGGYTYLLLHQLIYLSLSGIYLFYRYQDNENSKEGHLRWMMILWAGVSVWGFAYFSNYVLGWTSYLLGPLLYSLIVYLLSFYGLRNQRLFLGSDQKKRYTNLNLNNDELSRYKQKLLKLMDEEKPYLQTDFTLSKLSKVTNIPSHILSFILNDGLKQNFTELINSYRIDHAKELLTDPSNENLKIATIAYESGFNSLSSFNTAFKRLNKMTPSDFKNRSLVNLSN